MASKHKGLIQRHKSMDRSLMRIHARRRFKAIVHLVIANLFWMEDIDEDDVLGEDVKKNVQLLLRKRRDKKSLLTLTDKTIMCKDASERTEAEKMRLFKIIGDLKCFRKYPTDVKMKLAGVCYFMYFPPGRIIVKQFREGHSLYFIMSGEVAVSITVYDPILNEYNTTIVGTMEAGQMFGEVSLLHDIPRTATITTLTHCELIVLYKKEFDLVLKSTIQAVWDQILNSMKRFRYFDGWDDVSMRECCIYSRITTYRMGEIVYGTGALSDNYVHFILRGMCKCIEELPIIEQNIGSIVTYRLFDRRRYAFQLKSRRRSSAYRKSSISSKARQSRMSSGVSSKSSISEVNIEVQRLKKTEDLKKLLGMQSEKDETEDVEIPPNVKKIFMQVCEFNELACFGIGENMKHRKIIAATDYVECLLIPKFWIWSKNKGNIWTTVMHTLNRKIPNTSEIFKIFVKNREWGYAKRELVNALAKKPPCNTMNNVPYSIRLANDIAYGNCYGSNLNCE